MQPLDRPTQCAYPRVCVCVCVFLCVCVCTVCTVCVRGMLGWPQGSRDLVWFKKTGMGIDTASLSLSSRPPLIAGLLKGWGENMLIDSLAAEKHPPPHAQAFGEHLEARYRYWPTAIIEIPPPPLTERIFSLLPISLLLPPCIMPHAVPFAFRSALFSCFAHSVSGSESIPRWAPKENGWRW